MRAATAQATADRVAFLTLTGMPLRQAIQQVMQEFSVTTEDYVRRQVDWFDRHAPELFADAAYEAERDRLIEEEHEAALRIADD